MGDGRWDILIAHANFEKQPSINRLSDFCDKLAINETDLPNHISFRSAWPITAIIKVCSTREDYLKVAQDLRSGRLGTIDVLREAQSRWPKSADLGAIVSGTLTGFPWNLESIASTPPLQVFAHHSALPLKKLPKTKVSATIKSLSSLFSNLDSEKLRNDCAGILLACFEYESSKSKTPIEEIERWVEACDNAGYYIFSRLPNMTTEVLNRVARNIQSSDYYGPPDILTRAVLKSQGDSKVISLATEALKVNFESIESKDDDASIKMYLDALNLVKNCPNLEEENILIWELAAKIKIGNIDATTYDPSKISKLGPTVISKLLKQSASQDQLRTEEFSLELLAENPDLSNKRQILDAMQDVFTRRKSGLSNPAIWASLHIGFYHAFSKSEFESDYKSNIDTLQSIRIQNIRGVVELSHDFSEAKEGNGQFIVLIGENGAGKTTILRAIALALRDSSDLSIWPAGAFSSAWRSERTKSAGKILLNFSSGNSIETTITSSGQFRQSASTKGTRKPVFAYGCYRGSALGGPHSSTHLGEDGGPGIATLFDPEARLINAESWLVQLEARSLKEPDRAESFKAVIQALCDLLGINNLVIKGGVLFSEIEQDQEIPFSALSDGYLSMSGWFIDVVARWVEHMDQNNQKITKNFLNEAQCYILIDEIDAHIHPGWQLDVIHRAKTIFPKCIFVVTTHNPLTLAGASPHEILQLKRTAQEVKLIRGAMPPILLTGGQLYKQYFGIEQVIPTEIAKMIGRKLTLECKEDRNSVEEAELKSVKESLEKIELEGWEHVR